MTSYKDEDEETPMPNPKAKKVVSKVSPVYKNAELMAVQEDTVHV
jgi:hypothetical protein